MSNPRRMLVKGHGTGNDFLLTADPLGTQPLSAEEIQDLTDRHTGLGADGIIRAVRREQVSEPIPGGSTAEWFMDYRNADGSRAEMCGNGIRVFTAFLIREGLLTLADGDSTLIATRAGQVTVRREAEDFAVGLGPWSAPGGEQALAEGFDVEVDVAGFETPRRGLRLALPNPHTVVALADAEELERADLGIAPQVDPVPPHGSNVELVLPLGEQSIDLLDDDGAVIGSESVGVVQMRVHERGVGETLSCGTGAGAAALAMYHWFGQGAPQTWYVLVPGGRLRVTIGEQDQVELAGPAELVAEISLI